MTDAETTEKTQAHDSDSKLVSYWLAEIAAYDKKFEDWVSRCKRIRDRYRDERDKDEGKSAVSKYNVLWANTQILGPSVYFRQAKPWIERRFKEQNPAAKRSAEILERATSVQMEANQGEFHAAVLGCRDDWLLYARGTPWFRYEPTYESAEERIPLTLSETAETGSGHTYVDGDGKPFKPETEPKGGIQQDEAGYFAMMPYEQVVYEQVRTDYIAWEDFGHCVAERWEQVYGVWRTLHLLKAEVSKRFGKELAEKLSYDEIPEDVKDCNKEHPNFYDFAKTKVFEVWSKRDKKVFWIAPCYKTRPLDVQEDPLGLEQFFPCPKPLFGTMTTDSLVPVPDFSLYQDQAQELDDVTTRIKVLTAVLALKGAADATHQPLIKKLLKSAENDVVPVKDWVRLKKDGGIENVVEFFPLEEVAGVLKGLFEIRENLIDVIYQVTGLSDIMRGDTDPRETLGAQEKKSQYGSIRLRNKQEEIQRFNKDCVSIIAEIVAEHFEPTTLQLIAADPSDRQNPQVFQQAVMLLKDESLRTFRIDIETDSTTAIDEQMNKEAVNEYLASMSTFIEKIAGAMGAIPQAVPLMGELMQFAARQMKAGRSCEAAVEQFVQSVTESLQQPKQEPTDPAVVKAQADAQTKMQTEGLRAEIEKLKLALDKQKADQDAVIAQMEIYAKREIEDAKIASKEAIEQMKLDYQAVFESAERERKSKESDAKLAAAQAKSEAQPFA